MSIGSDRELSSLYREGAREEPPAPLDADILQAAREEVQERSRPWALPRWHVPLAAAAVLVLAVSMHWLSDPREDTPPPGVLHEKQPSASAEVRGSAGKESEPKLSQSPPREEPAPPSGPARDAAPSRSTGPSGPAAPPAGKPTDVPAPFAESGAEKSSAAPAQASSAPVEARAPGAPAAKSVLAPPEERAAARASSNEQESRSDRSEAKEESGASRPAAQTEARREVRSARSIPFADAPASSTPDATAAESSARGQIGALQRPAPEAAAKDPQRWLKEIEELQRAGRGVEARAQVELFRKRFPDYPLPEALQP